MPTSRFVFITRRILFGAAACFLAAWLLCCLVNRFKSLPAGLNVSSTARTVDASQLELLTDLTFLDSSGTTVYEQEIFDRLLRMIDEAQRLILLDQFLFNSFAGTVDSVHRRLCDEIIEALLKKRRALPNLPIVVVTDPINEVYGSDPSEGFNRLRRAGIDVVTTSLGPLRDSNTVFTGLWRFGFRPFGQDSGTGSLPHPFEPSREGVGLRSYLSLLNFKVNHRKVAICDSEGSHWVSMVSSANPHDGSSAHSNIAIVAHGGIAEDVYASEVAVLKLSERESPFDSLPGLREPSIEDSATKTSSVEVQLLTERGIRDALLETIRGSRPNEMIDVAVFYLSHRHVISELVRATQRGVRVRLILDPNKDAFGRTKSGIPNRPMAGRAMFHSQGKIELRWYDTHGEQFHCKALVRHGLDSSVAILGSANFTRRNLDGFNLETSVKLTFPAESKLDREFEGWFERMWSNRGGHFTVSADRYLDISKSRAALARFQEATGMGTF